VIGRASVALAAVALASALAVGQPLPSLVVPGPVRSPSPRAWRVPDAPYPAVTNVALEGSPQTAVVTLSEGGFALGLGAPPQVVFLEPSGTVRSRARLESMPRTLTAWHDGRVLVDDAAGQTLVVAPDGSLRAALSFLDAHEPDPWVLTPTGGAQRVAGQDARTFLQRLSATGDLLGSTPLPARLTGSTGRADGSFVYAAQRGLVFCDATGAWTRTPAMPGVRALVSLDDGSLALATDTAVHFTDPYGRPRATVALDASSHRLEAVAGGIVVTLLGTPSRALRLTADGSVVWRAELPTADMSLRFDRYGNALALSATGALMAFAADGHERWRMNLGTRVMLPPVPTAEGGWLVATMEGGVVRVGPVAASQGEGSR